MISQIANLAFGYVSTSGINWMYRYMKACGMEGADKMLQDMYELNEIDYDRFLQSVAHKAQELLANSESERINSPVGILELAKRILDGDMTDSGIVEYCVMDLQQRLIAYDSSVCGMELKALVRKYEAMVFMSDNFAWAMKYNESPLAYEMLSVHGIYVHEYNRCFLFKDTISSVEFSPLLSVMRVCTDVHTRIIDLSQPNVLSLGYGGFKVYDGTLEAVRKEILLNNGSGDWL